MTTADKIALFSAIGAWISGVATLLAVIISLYLANRKTKVRLSCVVGERLILTKSLDEANSRQPGIAIIVTNLSALPIKLTSIGWTCGNKLFSTNWVNRKKHYWHQMLGDIDSEDLPKRIEYGEQGFFWISLVGKEDTWFQEFVEQMKEVGANPQYLKISIATSSGGLFNFRPDDELIQKFSEYFNAA